MADAPGHEFERLHEALAFAERRGERTTEALDEVLRQLASIERRLSALERRLDAVEQGPEEPGPEPTAG